MPGGSDGDRGVARGGSRVSAGRRNDSAWASFRPIQEGPTEWQYQCINCSRIIPMSKKRVDRLKEHLKLCPALHGGACGDDRHDEVERLLNPPGEGAGQLEKENQSQDKVYGSLDTSSSMSSAPPPVVPQPSTSYAASLTARQSLSPPLHLTPQSQGCKRRHPSRSADIREFFVKTSAAEMDQISLAWAEFFFKNRLAFALADCPYFKAALEATRPGLTKDKQLFNRQSLGGKWLDHVEEQCHNTVKEQVKGQVCTICQDGWTNTNKLPIIATTLHCNGKSYPLDFEEVGSVAKTANFCTSLAKQSAIRAEQKYACKVEAFVSDSERKMQNVRGQLKDWRDGFIAAGCSSHALNLAAATATPRSIMANIVKINKAFRTGKLLSQLLSLGGRSPQLPSEVRWNSQTDAIESFLHNYNFMGQIIDDPAYNVDSSIKKLINNRGLVTQAKSMGTQLKKISGVLNQFQDDTKNLSDCILGWLTLLNDKEIMDEVRDSIKSRLEETATVHHIIAYLTDHRKDETWPVLPVALGTKGRQEFIDNGGQVDILAAYEVKDTTIFPEMVFDRRLKSLHPKKFWEWMATMTENPNVKAFCDYLVKVFSVPPSSAGIERVFSRAGLIHSNLRNRLGSKRVGKLVFVSQVLTMMSDEKEGSSTRVVHLEEAMEEEDKHDEGLMELQDEPVMDCLSQDSMSEETMDLTLSSD